MSNQKTFGLMDSLAIRVVVLIPGAVLFAIRRTQKRFVSVFASPLIILLASANPSMAETERFVEVSLDIEVTHYSSRTDGPEKRRRYSATCVIGEKRWSIDTKFILNAIERYYFDGTNVHRWAQVTEKAPAQPREPGQPILGNPGPEDGIWVKITPGKHPLGHLGVNVVWTAFCSASYLKSPARVIPIPGGEIRSRVDAFAYADKTKTFNDEPGLPETIHLFTSRDTFTLSRTNNPIARTSQSNRFHHVPDGLLALDYVATATTNVSGWTIPTKFAMTEYGEDRVGDWTRRVAVSGTVTSARPVAAVHDEPFQGKTYHVTDYRFRHAQQMINAIHYSRTNANISPVDDPDLQAQFDKAVQRAPADPLHAPGR